jgi:hypothetical protein
MPGLRLPHKVSTALGFTQDTGVLTILPAGSSTMRRLLSLPVLVRKYRDCLNQILSQDSSTHHPSLVPQRNRPGNLAPLRIRGLLLHPCRHQL